jgi:hypothetical protein
MGKPDEEAIYLEAVPLEWISERGNQQRVRQILSDNMDRLCGTSLKDGSEKVPVPSRREE